MMKVVGRFGKLGVEEGEKLIKREVEMGLGLLEVGKKVADVEA